ncbi:AEC family transporter [Marinilabilia sp.]|uniref:AEC family transporter n=1 Tax=Marinilabilia sp. TaxID=2021252 RepID=UPI0025B7BE5B|nr:AEC family transporter [Marinilabilia sp.]
MQTQIITEQIIIAGIIVLVGAIGSWLRVINEDLRFSISRLVFNITLPLLIVTTVSRMEMSHEVLVNGGWAAFFSVVSVAIMYVIGKLSVRILRLPTRVGVVHELHTMFGNIVFLGFPLVAALYPDEEALLYATIYYMVSSFMQWTYAVFRLKGQVDVSFRERFRNLLNPNTVAFVVGIVMFLIQLKLPEMVHIPLSSIGKATSPLALLYIGSTLARTSIRGAMKRPDIYLLSLNKLILIPVILLVVISLAVSYLGVELGQMAKTIIVLETAMPCMSMIVIMAKAYGAADDRAAENVFLTTLLSLLTLPLVFYLASVL